MSDTINKLPVHRSQREVMADLRRELAGMGDANLAELRENRQLKHEVVGLEQQTAEIRMAESDRIKQALGKFVGTLPLAEQSFHHKYGRYRYSNGHDTDSIFFTYDFWADTMPHARDLDQHVLWVPTSYPQDGSSWPKAKRSEWDNQGYSWTPAYIVGKRLISSESQNDAYQDLLLSPALRNGPNAEPNKLSPMVARVSMRGFEELTSMRLRERGRQLTQDEYDGRFAEDGRIRSDSLTSKGRLKNVRYTREGYPDEGVLKLQDLPFYDESVDISTLPRRLRKQHERAAEIRQKMHAALVSEIAATGLRALLMWDDDVMLSRDDLADNSTRFSIYENAGELADVFGAQGAFDKTIGKLELPG